MQTESASKGDGERTKKKKLMLRNSFSLTGRKEGEKSHRGRGKSILKEAKGGKGYVLYEMKLRLKGQPKGGEVSTREKEKKIDHHRES